MEKSLQTLRPTFFSYKRVFSNAYEMVGAKAVLIFLLAFLFVGVPMFFYEFIDYQFLHITPTSMPEIVFEDLSFWNIFINEVVAFNPYLWGGVVVQSIFFAWYICIFTRKFSIEEHDDPLSASSTRPRIFHLFLPALILSVVTEIGYGIAMIAFVLPAYFLWVIWFVCVPVLAQENLSIFEALKRSFMIVKGYKWRIFRLTILSTFFTIGMLLVCETLASSFGVTNELGYISDASSYMNNMAYSLISAIGETFIGVFDVAIIVATYRELRFLEDGEARALSDIFD